MPELLKLKTIHHIDSKVKYELVKQIGKGSFANVFLAIRRGFGMDRYVAVKLINMKNLSKKHQTVIIDEAKVTGKLSHPNILHVYDCGMTDDNHFFIVTELVNGYSLKEVIKEHTNKVMKRLKGHDDIPLSLMRHAAASILIHTAHGLKYINQAQDLLTGEPMNVIHSDLKPGNILIGFNGTLKVSDFGISYSPIRSVKLKGGSPAYMAPEWIQSILNGKNSEKPRVTFDIYSLGVCLHETLTDRRLFRAPRPNMSREAMLKAIHQQMKEFKSGYTLSVNPAADKFLCRIVDRCLKYKAKDRYQTMDDIIHEIDDLISDGIYHPEILDRRFLSEYMGSVYPGTDVERFQKKLGV